MVTLWRLRRAGTTDRRRELAEAAEGCTWTLWTLHRNAQPRGDTRAPPVAEVRAGHVGQQFDEGEDAGEQAKLAGAESHVSDEQRQHRGDDADRGARHHHAPCDVVHARVHSLAQLHDFGVKLSPAYLAVLQRNISDILNHRIVW